MLFDVCMTPAFDDVNDSLVISTHPDVTIPFAQNHVLQSSVTKQHFPSESKRWQYKHTAIFLAGGELL